MTTHFTSPIKYPSFSFPQEIKRKAYIVLPLKNIRRLPWTLWGITNYLQVLGKWKTSHQGSLGSLWSKLFRTVLSASVEKWPAIFNELYFIFHINRIEAVASYMISCVKQSISCVKLAIGHLNNNIMLFNFLIIDEYLLYKKITKS